MKKLVVFGSLNTDLTIQCDRLPINGETVHGSDFMINVGGKGCNQAIGSAKSGCRVEFIGGVGDDVFGKKILDTLKEYKINTENVQVIKNCPTGTAVITRNNGDNRIILDSGANYNIDIDKAEKTLEKLACKKDIFLTQFENRFDVVKLMLKKAKSLGMYTILNPAPAQFIEKEVYKDIDMIILNQSETKVLTGIYPENSETCIEAMKAMDSFGVKSSIITLGSKGSVSMIDGKLHKAEAYKVKVVDSTGAGDAYIGALISRMVKDMNLVDCMSYATKVSALTILKTGAEKSIPFEKEVNEHFKDK